jgi:hypothetical protein
MSLRFFASIAAVILLFSSISRVFGQSTVEDLDTGEILERMISGEEANYELARVYEYEQETVTEKLDKDGKVVKSTTKTEKQKLQKHIGYKVQGVKRGEEVETSVGFEDERDEKPREEGTYLEAMTIRDLSRYYDFTRVADEPLDGVWHYVLAFKPKDEERIPKAKSREEKVLEHLAGKLWVHPKDFSIVKSDSRLVSPLPFAIIDLVSLRDLHIQHEAFKLDDKVWMPKRMEVRYSVRILYFSTIRERQRGTMRNYAKVETAPVAQP